MRHWYLLNIKPKKEFQVEKIFREASFDIYLPKHKEKESIKPFFPSYEFIRFDYPGEYNLIKYTRGVKTIVGNKAGPIPLPDQMIDEIRSHERDGLIVISRGGAKALSRGDAVEVIKGPLKGLSGVFQQDLTGRERVLIILSYVSYQGRLMIERSKINKVG